MMTKTVTTITTVTIVRIAIATIIMKAKSLQFLMPQKIVRKSQAI